MEDVVDADRQRDERDLMRLQKLDRLGELTAERVRADAAGNHRLRRLAGAPELREAKLGMAQLIVAVKVVEVTLIGLDEQAGPAGLDASRQGITKRKIVNGWRGSGCGSVDPERQDCADDHQPTGHRDSLCEPFGEYTTKPSVDAWVCRASSRSSLLHDARITSSSCEATPD